MHTDARAGAATRASRKMKKNTASLLQIHWPGILASSEPQACSIGGLVLFRVGLVCLVCCRSRTSREPRASLHRTGVGASNPESESQSALSHPTPLAPPRSARAMPLAIGKCGPRARTEGRWHRDSGCRGLAVRAISAESRARKPEEAKLPPALAVRRRLHSRRSMWTRALASGGLSGGCLVIERLFFEHPKVC